MKKIDTGGIPDIFTITGVRLEVIDKENRIVMFLHTSRDGTGFNISVFVNENMVDVPMDLFDSQSDAIKVGLIHSGISQ